MSTSAQDIHPICKMRSGIVCLSLFFGFALIGCRLFYLQVLQSDAGAHEVQRQHQKSMMVQSDRGVIVDRHGHPLALNVDVPSVFVNPRTLQNPRQTAQALAPVLDMRVAQLRKLFQQSQSRIRLKRHIPEEKSQADRDDGNPRGRSGQSPSAFLSQGRVGFAYFGLCW